MYIHESSQHSLQNQNDHQERHQEYKQNNVLPSQKISSSLNYSWEIERSNLISQNADLKRKVETMSAALESHEASANKISQNQKEILDLRKKIVEGHNQLELLIHSNESLLQKCKMQVISLLFPSYPKKNSFF